MLTVLSQIKVLIADDHGLFRRGLKTTLKELPFITVIDEAENGIQVLQLLEQNTYDIIFLDIQMPEMDGIATLTSIRKFNDKIKIIALSMFADQNYIMEMYKNRANGYLLKNTDYEELNRAIHNVMENERYYTPVIRDKLFRMLMKSENEFKRISSPKIEISEREADVLLLICEQFATQEISDKLYIATTTVKSHRKSLLDKTNSKNIAGLVLFALREGLYSLD